MADPIEGQNQGEKPPEPQAGDTLSLWEDKPQGGEGAPAPQDSLPPEPVDQRERSQLGRKVAEQQQMLAQMSDNINRLTQMLADREASNYVDPYAPPRERRQDPYSAHEPTEEDLYDRPVNTYRDIKEREAIEKRMEAQRETAYVTNYVRRVKSLGIGSSADPELHKEVEKELLQEGYQNYMKATGHPIRDAEINYDRAKAKVLERKYREAVNRPNVQGDKENAPSGLSTTGRVTPPPQSTVELDDYSRKFIKAVGAKETDEWVQKSLKRKD